MALTKMDVYTDYNRCLEDVRRLGGDHEASFVQECAMARRQSLAEEYETQRSFYIISRDPKYLLAMEGKDREDRHCMIYDC